MAAMCPSLNIDRWSLTVAKCSMSSQPVDRMRPSIAPDVEPLRVCSFPERVHHVKIPTGHVRSTLTRRAPSVRSSLFFSARANHDDISIRQRPSNAGPTRQICSVGASVKITRRTGQRPGSARCEALALGLVCAAANTWPDAEPTSG
jgi:hypothetical protein